MTSVCWNLTRFCFIVPNAFCIEKKNDKKGKKTLTYSNYFEHVKMEHVTPSTYTGWPTKISIFFFGDNLYKNKENFKIFFPQILEVYRILLSETILESIMFYFTFSVINTMFVPCTALLYDSTAETRTIKLSTTLLSISCGIRLISFLMMSSLVCGLFSQTLSFRFLLRK